MSSEPGSRFLLTVEIIQGGGRTNLTYESPDRAEFAEKVREIAAQIYPVGTVSIGGPGPRDAFGLAADRSRCCQEDVNAEAREH